jgi:radical SAM superfamily enzyme YgiQ (UPF0313 family)
MSTGKRKSVVLVDPVKLSHREGFERIGVGTYYSGTSIGIRDPLGLEYVAAALEGRGYRCTLLMQGEMSDGRLCAEIVQAEPLAVGFSLWSYNVEHVKGLAAMVKKRMKDVYIIVGGYHPTFQPGIVQDENIDFAVTGEGEGPACDLLDCLSRGGDLKKVKGIAFQSLRSGDIIVNAPADRLEFASLPWPLRSREICNLSKITGLTYFPPSRQRSPLQVSYSRGCPHRCDFCPSGRFWRQRVSYRDPGDTAREIDWLNREFGTNYVYFSDLTFNCHREKVRQLCRAMIAAGLPGRVKWSAMAKIDPDGETLQEMKEAGCGRLAFGVEVFGADAARTLKPWQDLASIEQTLQAAANLGIITRCFLLTGFPEETEEDCREMETYLRQLPIDNIRLAFVSPFPGTKLYERYRESVSGDWSRYTGEYPILPNAGIPGSRWVEIRKELIRSFYNSPEYIERAIKKVRRFPYLKESFEEFLETYLLRSGILDDGAYARFKRG